MRVLMAIVVLAAGTTVVRPDGYLDDALSYLRRCRSGDLAECAESDLTRTVDDAMHARETYRLNRYLTVAVRRDGTGGGRAVKNGVDDLGTRLLDLFNALHVQYRPEETEDDFEGRGKKKKDKKHKKGMMMAGAAMIMTLVGGLIMKLKLKIILLIALKALFIAKFALVLAGTIAIKKLLSGNGGTGVQPVFASGSGDQGSGYRRSYAQANDDQYAHVSTASSLAYKDQISSYSNVQYIK